MPRITLFALFILLFTSCQAQDQQHSSPKNTKAVPKLIAKTSSSASSPMLQDRAGHLWYGAKDGGVYRYDGKNFTKYSEEDGLSHNDVHTIFEDNKGVIWFGTVDGVTCYDGKTFSSIPITKIQNRTAYRKTYRDSYGATHPVENSVNSILQDRTGIYWLGTSHGLHRYDGKTFTHISNPYGALSDSQVYSALGAEALVEDQNGHIWFGGRGIEGVYKYDGQNLQQFKPNGEHWLRPLGQDQKGNVWFGSRTGPMLYRYDGQKFTAEAEKEITNWVFYMIEDAQGQLWFSNLCETLMGQNPTCTVTRYDGKTFKNLGLAEGYNFPSAHGILLDRAGNVWFNAGGMQLCRYDGKKFTYINGKVSPFGK